jgi:hypothetical protein
VLAFSIDRALHGEKAFALQLHRSFGLTIWMVMLGWRQFTGFSPLAPDRVTASVVVAPNLSSAACRDGVARTAPARQFGWLR